MPKIFEFYHNELVTKKYLAKWLVVKIILWSKYKSHIFFCQIIVQQLFPLATLSFHEILFLRQNFAPAVDLPSAVINFKLR